MRSDNDLGMDACDGDLQLAGMARAGDVVGEIGVLCYKPQLFTARTRTLCQLLRMERTAFLRIVQANVGDGTIIINNLIQASLVGRLQVAAYELYELVNSHDIALP